MTTTISSLHSGTITVNTTNYATVNPPSIILTAPVLGDVRHRSPEPSGYFVPGKFRVNPVLMYKTSGVCEPANLSGTSRYPGKTGPPQYTSHLTGDLMAYYQTAVALPAPPTSIQQWALQEAFARLNEPQVGISLMLAELAETLQLLRNPFKALETLTQKLRTGRPKPNQHLIDFLGDSWLSFQYGVVPLMCDIQSILEAVEKGLKANEERMFVFKGGASTESVNSMANLAAVFAYYRLQVRKRVETTYKATACVYSKQSLIDDTMFHVANFGFDPRQVLGLAWELVPYSFVADWFLSVGNWLKALTPLPNYRYLGNCISIKSIQVYTVEAVAPAYVPTIYGRIESTNPGKFTKTTTQLQRVVGAPLSALPAVDWNPLNLKRVLSSLALTWQQIPTKWKRILR